MKVYIAAPFPIRDQAIEVMRHLESDGIEVTSRWLRNAGEDNDEWARNDLDDVAAADLLLALNPAGWEDKGTGGRHVELGYALHAGIPVVLLGVRSNIFHHLSCVRVIERLEDL